LFRPLANAGSLIDKLPIKERTLDANVYIFVSFSKMVCKRHQFAPERVQRLHFLQK
jgi:hypothetical protein